jgi:hypothetical protein
MRRVCTAVGLTILLVAFAAEPAGAHESYDLVLPGRMAVLGPDGKTASVTRFEIRRSTLEELGSRRTLCYGLDGKETSVKLGEHPGTSSRWILTKIRARGDTEYVSVQAAEGKLKGWYLDYTEELDKAASGHTAHPAPA